MNIIPTAEPFYFQGNNVGCLLIHGFTGAPKEMRWMGEYLAEQNFTVLGIRLAGHATQPEDLVRTRWTDWVSSAEDGWHILNGVTEHVFTIGLSLGGVLSLYLASQFPVAGVVTMSTPYDLPDDRRTRFLKVLKYVIPYVSKRHTDQQDQEAANDHINYPNYPTKGIAELNDLMAEMRAVLPRVTAPVLMIHSQGDTSVPIDDMQNIFDRLGSQNKQISLLENSGHVIPRGDERERAFEAAGDFIRQVMTT
jgi:carboxylesterase